MRVLFRLAGIYNDMRLPDDAEPLLREYLRHYQARKAEIEQHPELFRDPQAALRWVDAMLVDEHGLELEGPEAARAAWWTFGAFCIAGAVPIAPFILEELGWMPIPTWEVAVAATAITFFVIGMIKGKVVNRSVFRDGVETLALGGAAAFVAFGVGWLLRGLANGL